MTTAAFPLPPGAMRATNADAEADAPRRALVATAWLMLLLALPTASALLLDTRALGGVGVWVKPLKFEASLSLHMATVAWGLLALPAAQRGRRLVAATTALMIAAAVLEIAYIVLRAARGEASHFNVGTPLDAALYAAMGVGAVTLVAGTGVVGALVLRHRARGDVTALAVGLGLVLGALLGGVSGAYMSGQTGHGVGVAAGAAALPVVGWSRDGGDLRVAHFVGLHLMQALPLVALVTGALTAAARRRWVVGAAVAGSVVTVLVFAQAVAGRPLLAAG